MGRYPDGFFSFFSFFSSVFIIVSLHCIHLISFGNDLLKAKLNRNQINKLFNSINNGVFKIKTDFFFP